MSLAGVAVLAVAFAVVLAVTRDVRERHRIESELTAMGANHVGFNEDSEPEWISFAGPVASPEIAKYRSLRHLDLERAHVTRASVENIAGLEQLFALHLTDSDVTDEHIDILAKIGSLQILRLGGTQITDNAIDSIAAIKDLKAVDLSRTSVTAEGTNRLKALKPGLTVRWVAKRAKASGHVDRAQPRRKLFTRHRVRDSVTSFCTFTLVLYFYPRFVLEAISETMADLRWDRVPSEFHYLREVVEACGETRVELYDEAEQRHVPFIEKATDEQIALIRSAKEEIEKREDLHLLIDWCRKASKGRPSEKLAAWSVQGVLFLLDEV